MEAEKADTRAEEGSKDGDPVAVPMELWCFYQDGKLCTARHVSNTVLLACIFILESGMCGLAILLSAAL